MLCSQTVDVEAEARVTVLTGLGVPQDIRLWAGRRYREGRRLHVADRGEKTHERHVGTHSR